MAKTEYGKYRFVVKESDNGVPSLALEPAGQALACLGKGLLVLKLRKGTTVPQAQEIAKSLNTEIVEIGYTA
jgi:hypothetical protein